MKMLKVTLLVLLSVITFDVANAAIHLDFNHRDRERRRHERFEKRNRYHDRFDRHNHGPRNYHDRDYRYGY